MTWLRTEEEVDKMIEDMCNRSKGKYITQGVSFNKSCPRQMELLKMALMASVSFSGLGKELLAIKFEKRHHAPSESIKIASVNHIVEESIVIESPKLKNVGNFL